MDDQDFIEKLNKLVEDHMNLSDYSCKQEIIFNYVLSIVENHVERMAEATEDMTDIPF